MAYSPMTMFLADLKKRLSQLDMPIHFKLPDEDELEPFVVIGAHDDDDSQSAKFGLSIINTELQIDIFYPIDSRTAAEEVATKAKGLIGKRNRVTSSIRPDNSIGREVYHIVLKIQDLVF